MVKKIERIILIDDDDVSNFYNKIILEQNDVAKEIIFYENAKDALEFIKTTNTKVDLILLDLNMPMMNGWEFLEKFKKLDSKKQKSIVIVILTSSVNSDDKDKAKKIDLVKEYINKPLNQENIKKILNLFK